MQSYLWVSSVLFGLIAVGHFLRLARDWSVEIAGGPVPTWISLVALFVAAGLSLWGLRLLRRGLPPAP